MSILAQDHQQDVGLRLRGRASRIDLPPAVAGLVREIAAAPATNARARSHDGHGAVSRRAEYRLPSSLSHGDRGGTDPNASTQGLSGGRPGLTGLGSVTDRVS